MFRSALADHLVSCSHRSVQVAQARFCGTQPIRSIAAQVACHQLLRAGLSLPIVMRRFLPANRTAQVSPCLLLHALAGLSPPIAPRRSLPANCAVQVSPANRAALDGAINAVAAPDIVQD